MAQKYCIVELSRHIIGPVLQDLTLNDSIKAMPLPFMEKVNDGLTIQLTTDCLMTGYLTAKAVKRVCPDAPSIDLIINDFYQRMYGG